MCPAEASRAQSDEDELVLGQCFEDANTPDEPELSDVLDLDSSMFLPKFL